MISGSETLDLPEAPPGFTGLTGMNLMLSTPGTPGEEIKKELSQEELAEIIDDLKEELDDVNEKTMETKFKLHETDIGAMAAEDRLDRAER